MENPQQLMRSWALQGSFANGAVSQDKLVPREFTRIRTPFINTWRQEQLASTCDWESQAFSWHVPESLRIVSSMFLRIELPATGGGNYKAIPGLYVLDQIRFLSQGSESYKCDPALYLRDYIESLSDEAAKRFCATFLGYKASQDGAPRVLMIPILLPNSAYLFRQGRDTRGHGVFPCYLGTNRLEIQFKMNPATHTVVNGATAPGSIANRCSISVHQVEVEPRNLQRYSDSRGTYSVMTRRFTEITDGWTNVQAATKHKINQAQPIGNVTELFCLAVPEGTAADDRSYKTQIRADFFQITSDSVVQKSLDTSEKVEMELWQNGFIGNSVVNSPSRLCFAAHCAEAENLYSGAYNMAHSSNITVETRFKEAVDMRIYAVQLQRIVIDADGNVVSSLD
jgi:hypothetical protein